MVGFRSRLPPVNALVVFEAVARNLGFTAAAGELRVSQAAVSRQVRLLEDHLGVRLFSREGRRVRLTPAGEELHGAVTMGLGHIAGVTDRLRAGGDSVLTVATTIAFSAFWLMPRIGRFHAAHPEVELRLVTSDSAGSTGDADVAVVFGQGRRPGFTADRLFGEEIVAVCHADYLAGREAPEQAADLRKERLLQLDTGQPTWLAWEAWFARLGVTGRDLPGPRFNDYTIAIQAARDGRGVALGWRRLIEPDLAEGRLLRLTDASVVPDEAYHLLLPDGRAGEAKLRAFRDWIVEAAARDWG